jgi:hypothetical protein
MSVLPQHCVTSSVDVRSKRANLRHGSLGRWPRGEPVPGVLTTVVVASTVPKS